MPALTIGTTPEAIAAEIARRRYLRDPVSWITERCGEHVWSKQRLIVESTRDHRRTAVKSCHGAGKSFIAARLACWWIANHPPGQAFVVTTATTGSQVKAVLWREMHRVHSRAKLPGRMNQSEWYMDMPAGHEELVAFGRKPADFDPTAFQGIHARWVLVIFDEACGVPTPIWEAAEGLISNDESRIVVIGNPTDPQTEFAEVCKPGSGWNVIRISAYDTPNFTGEPIPEDLRHVLVGKTWVEEKLRKWGENNPLYISKILGDFPDVSNDGLIPIRWVREAQEAALEPGMPIELGVDVGGGGDKSVVALRRGPVVRIVASHQNPNTMETTGQILIVKRQHEATAVKVDEIGIGRGVVDRGLELGEPFIGINVGEQPKDREHYVNRRAELYWGLRERFQDGEVDLDPADDDTAAELVALKFKVTSHGKIQIESKDEMRRRGLNSPDRADAVMLAFAPDEMGLSASELASYNDPGPSRPRFPRM